jgi:hypothetical protein
MNYRCVVSNKEYKQNTYEVLAIGTDECQSGDYHEIGSWCDFTFYPIPKVSDTIWEWVYENEYKGDLRVVENGEIRVKTLVELIDE